MSDLVMALKTMGAQINTVLSAAQLQQSGTVFRGWPTSVEYARIIAQDKGSSQVTLWPLKGKSTTAYNTDDIVNLQRTQPKITVSIDDTFTILTILTAPGAGDNLHAFFGYPTQDANFGPATGNESMGTVALAIAAKVNGMSLPGVGATTSGNEVILTGALWAYANIGGSATMTMVTAQEARPVQCSVWAPDALSREAIGTAIIAGIGGVDQPRLTMPDGNIMLCLYDDDIWNDKAVSSYSSYRWDIFFNIEYAITKVVNLVQVEGFSIARSIDNVTLTTEHFGNPDA